MYSCPILSTKVLTLLTVVQILHTLVRISHAEILISYHCLLRWVKKSHYVNIREKVSVPAERRKISVLPYIEEYLKGSDEDLSDDGAEVYQTCKQADLQLLRIGKTDSKTATT